MDRGELGDHPLIRLSGDGAASVRAARFTGFLSEADLALHVQPVNEPADVAPNENGEIPATAIEDLTATAKHFVVELYFGPGWQSAWVAAEWNEPAQVLDLRAHSSNIGLSGGVTSGPPGPQTMLLDIAAPRKAAEILFLAGTAGKHSTAEALAKEYARGSLEPQPLLPADSLYVIDWTRASDSGIPVSTQVPLCSAGGEPGQWSVVKRQILGTANFDPVEALFWALSVRDSGVAEAVIWTDQGDAVHPRFVGGMDFTPVGALQDEIRARMLSGASTFRGFLPGGGFTLVWPMSWTLTELPPASLIEAEQRLRTAARLEEIMSRIEAVLAAAVAEIEAGHQWTTVRAAVEDVFTETSFGPKPDSVAGGYLALERIEGVVDSVVPAEFASLNSLIRLRPSPLPADIEATLAGVRAVAAELDAFRQGRLPAANSASAPEVLDRLAALVETRTFAGALAAVLDESHPAVIVRASRFTDSSEGNPAAGFPSLFARIGLQGYDPFPGHGRAAWRELRLPTISGDRPRLARSLTPRLDLYMRRLVVGELFEGDAPAFDSAASLRVTMQAWKERIAGLDRETFLKWVLGRLGSKSLRPAQASFQAPVATEAAKEADSALVYLDQLLEGIHELAGLKRKFNINGDKGRSKLICSGVRTFAGQAEGFLRKGGEKRKEEDALREKAAPGTSRHHFGSDVDLWKIDNEPMRDPDQPEAVEYEFMRRYAHFFGWILPYAESRFRQIRTWVTYEFDPNDGESTGKDMSEVAAAARTDTTRGYHGECWHWSYWPVAQAVIELARERQPAVHEMLVAEWNDLDGSHHSFRTSKQFWPDYVFNLTQDPRWPVGLDD